MDMGTVRFGAADLVEKVYQYKVQRGVAVL